MSTASIPKLLTGVLTTLAANLSQSVTNGVSRWGTLDAPTFPKFLTNNPLPSGFPWGPLTATNANPYKAAPFTGVTRRYNFEISRMNLRPDGVVKDMIVVNGQFPGPTIEANWGDWIEVTVKNNLKNEGTALHWHGLLQQATPWFDGVPSVQQCPIAPGKSLTYRFRADIYGSSWWHSHYSGQYAGGLLGPMIIHGPNHLSKEEDYDIDSGPVFLTDWYHRDYFSIVKDVMSTDINRVLAAGVSQNNLINGKMNYDCSRTNQTCTPNAGISKFKFQTGKKHRLRIINAGSEGQQKFSIDEHELTVIAHDFVPVKPYKVNMVSLGIGQRVDVVVTANKNATGSYFMRSSIQTGCTPSDQPDALAAIYYPLANQRNLPTSRPQPDTLADCHNTDYSLTSIEPVFKITPPEPDITHEIEITFAPNATGHFLWRMNDSSFRANFNNPVLILANKGNTSFPTNWNVIDSGAAKQIRVILKNNTPARHPMHLHGHNMLELAAGDGLDWDGTIAKPANPLRRDTHVIKRNGHYVFQYEADNPGIWPFHCHIAWHVSGGLYVNLMERPADIRKLNIPQTMHQTCRDWATFTGTNVVEQIDSGL